MILINLLEIVTNNEVLFILLYCFLILWINIGYLKEHKQIKENLAAVSSKEESEMLLSPGSISTIFIVLIFNFFRSWLLYLFAIFITENIFVLMISVVLFVFGLYDSIFNYSFAHLKKSNLKLYIIIADTVFIVLFIIYLLLYK